jgi:dimethylglycine dehydrogenase
MQKVSPYDFSNDYFRFMEMKQVSVGLVECLVGRVSYTGDLGYEIWMEAENQRSVFQTLMQEGESLGIGLFGLRALNSLRLEKNFGSWAREFRPIYGPMEAGLNPFVAYDKEADFIGKEIARKEKEEGGNLRLRTFVVDAKDADVIGDEPIWHGGEVKGWVTSGGFAHGSGVSMAMGYVPREIADQTSGWEIEILNERCSCKLQPKPLFDPEAKIMRG